MANISTYFPAGGGGAVCPTFHFNTGCTCWCPTKDGCAVVHIIGGGSGGCNASGGGAGGYIRYATSFSTADTGYCIVVGAAGGCLGGCSLMCNATWCMVAYGACCATGGGTAYSTTPNGTNETYAQGGNGSYGGGAVGIFASPGGQGYSGGSLNGCSSAGGAGVGGAGGKGCCRYIDAAVRVLGGGGGSAGPGNTSYDVYGTYFYCVDVSQGGPALVTTPAQYHGLFKFVPYWGAGGAVTAAAGCRPACAMGGAHTMTMPGPGGGGGGGPVSMGGQDAGMFAGGGSAFIGGDNGGLGGRGGYPGGGAGGGCNVHCWNNSYRGGAGAVFVEYIEV